MTSITRWCTIVPGNVSVNGNAVFCGPSKPFDGFLKKAFEHRAIDYPKFFKMDEMCKAGLIAGEYLLEGKPLAETYGGGRVGVVLASSNSSLAADYLYQETINDPRNYFPRPALFTYTLPNIVMGELCIRHGFTGENNFFISKRFDPKLLADYAHILIDNGLVAACVLGWVDIYRQEMREAFHAIEMRNEVFLCIVEPGKAGDIVFNETSIARLYNEGRQYGHAG